MGKKGQSYIFAFLFIGVLATGKSGSAIVGGEETAAGEWTSVVSLNECTATVVAPRFLLTAAHCDHLARGFVTISPHSTLGGRSYPVRQVHVHPLYERKDVKNEDAANNGYYDVAVIELEHPIVVDPNAPEPPVEPGEKKKRKRKRKKRAQWSIPGLTIATIDLEPPAPDEIMTIVGFGATRGVSWSAWQRHGGNFQGKKLARLAVDKIRHDIVDLKNASGTGACFGDSGGPMFRVDGLQEYLVGVVFMISGSRCATEGGYSSAHLLAYSEDWFRGIVGE